VSKRGWGGGGVGGSRRDPGGKGSICRGKEERLVMVSKKGRFGHRKGLMGKGIQRFPRTQKKKKKKKKKGGQPRR